MARRLAAASLLLATLANWRWAPRYAAAFLGRGVNAGLAWRAAWFGDIGATLQAAAMYASHGK
jgi:hypothetical protein